jgi:hypothetical protein
MAFREGRVFEVRGAQAVNGEGRLSLHRAAFADGPQDCPPLRGGAVSLGRDGVITRELAPTPIATTLFRFTPRGYVMLVLAIVIALMGITNTLSLSVHERTRELGLLRAVGQTRRQTRTMIRWESVTVVVLGTLGGVVLGTFLAWALIRASAVTGASRGIGAAVARAFSQAGAAVA